MTTTSTLVTYQTLTRQPNGDIVINYHTSPDGLTLPTDSDGNVLQGQDLADYLQTTPWEDIIPYYSIPDAIEKPITNEMEYKIENGELLGVKNHHFVDDYNEKYSTNLTANTDYVLGTAVISDAALQVNSGASWTNNKFYDFLVDYLTNAPQSYKFYSVSRPDSDSIIPHPTEPDIVAATAIIACTTGSWQLQRAGHQDGTDGSLLTPQGLVSASQSNGQPAPAIPWTGKNRWRFTSIGEDRNDYVCIRPKDGVTFWNRYQQPVNQGDTITNDIPNDYAHNDIISSTSTSVQYIFVVSGILQDTANEGYTRNHMIDCSVSPSLTALTSSTIIKIWR